MISIALFDHNPTMVPVAAGQALFRQGEEGSTMFVLASGTAEVVINAQVVETLEHGSIVGEIGMVLPGPHSASVIAKSDCEFVAVMNGVSSSWCSRHPSSPPRSCASWPSACARPISCWPEARHAAGIRRTSRRR